MKEAPNILFLMPEVEKGVKNYSGRPLKAKEKGLKKLIQEILNLIYGDYHTHHGALTNSA
jgi:hypothetical protein